MRGFVGELRHAMRHPWARLGARAAVLALALAALAFAAGWAARGEHEALEHSLVAKRRELATADRALELARAYRIASEKLPQLERKLSASASQARLVAELSGLARRHGVRIVAQSFDEQRATAGGQILAAELSVEARYESLRDFVRGLYGLPLWIEVQELRFAAARPAPGGVAGRIRLVTYRTAGKGAS